MIFEVKYKGRKVDLNDIEIVYNNYRGEKTTGSIKNYGKDRWTAAWYACEGDLI